MLHSEKIMSGMVARKPNEESQQQEAAPVKQQNIDPRVKDAAKEILLHAGMVHEITEEQAADAWDAYFSARTSDQFAAKLNAMDIPNALKHELYLAHHEYRHIEPSRVDKVVDVINKRLPSIHKSDRSGKSPATVAEKHPRVFQSYLEAQKQGEE